MSLAVHIPLWAKRACCNHHKSCAQCLAACEQWHMHLVAEAQSHVTEAHMLLMIDRLQSV